jgi:tetratricopeptide (TPR) repeat protein
VQELFARADQERRRGHSDKAIALYRELQTEFDTSAEAHLSRVSLRRLLLEAERWDGALEQFDRHLTQNREGVLAAEALYGRARALQALGREARVRRSWDGLSCRFPDSTLRTWPRAI